MFWTRASGSGTCIGSTRSLDGTLSLLVFLWFLFCLLHEQLEDSLKTAALLSFPPPVLFGNNRNYLCLFAGNHMLLRVLPSVYPRQPEPIHCHLHSLLAMMLQLEGPEQQHLIRLIQAVAEKHPVVSIWVAVVHNSVMLRKASIKVNWSTVVMILLTTPLIALCWITKL